MAGNSSGKFHDQRLSIAGICLNRLKHRKARSWVFWEVLGKGNLRNQGPVTWGHHLTFKLPRPSNEKRSHRDTPKRTKTEASNRTDSETLKTHEKGKDVHTSIVYNGEKNGNNVNTHQLGDLLNK